LILGHCETGEVIAEGQRRGFDVATCAYVPPQSSFSETSGTVAWWVMPEIISNLGSLAPHRRPAGNKKITVVFSESSRVRKTESKKEVF